MPAQAAQQAAAWAEQARDARGHALRKDGLCFVAGVVTWPEARPEAEWAGYRAASIKWLQDKYQNRLLSVVEHHDESHPHIHYFCVPLPGERFEILHPGRAAAAEAKAAGLLKGAQNRAYKDAMRAWQADFHREVSQHHGLTRLGPQRRRLTRAEWKAEQAEAERQAAEAARLARSTELVDLQRENLAQATALAEARAERLAQEHRALQEIIQQAQRESAVRAKQIRAQASAAFQSSIDSRRRREEWQRQRPGLTSSPPTGLTYAQIERRRELAAWWNWLEDPADIRRRAVEASRQGREALRQIEERLRQAREAERRADAQAREVQERLAGLKPLQIFEKTRLASELQAAEKALAEAKAEQKRLAVDEKKLLSACPAEVVAKYQHSQEAEREKALAELLRREAQEIEEERRREEAEAKARAERRAMRPAPKPKKPGGWEPPRP
jgi:hypothetical protein